MMPLIISATDLRTRAREIMQRVKFKQEAFLVENFGEPMAVIISVTEYENLLAQSSKSNTQLASVTGETTVKRG
jgi:prevent-host-death family protein